MIITKDNTKDNNYSNNDNDYDNIDTHYTPIHTQTNSESTSTHSRTQSHVPIAREVKFTLPINNKRAVDSLHSKTNTRALY